MSNKQTKVLVLMGGDSPERDVSLRSGKAVAVAAKEAGFDIAVYDPADGDDGLIQAVQSADVVLPILHGVNGEDGVIQQKLQDLGTRYLGADSVASANAFDKKISHDILEQHGILMPHYAIVSAQDISHELFSKPFVLKPIDGGSSLDTLIVRQVDDATQLKITELLSNYEFMLLEQLIEGQEITVPVLGDVVLPVISIIPPEDDEFDYANKYNGKTQEICPIPVDFISQEVQLEAQQIALAAHTALSARHLSRTDMILDSNGLLYTLELNTIPGMADVSLLPKSAAAAGLSMVDLVVKLIDLVTS